MTAYGVSGIFIVLTAIPIALLAVRHQPGRPTSSAYFIFYGVTIVIWGVGAILIGSRLDHSTSLLVWKLAHVGVALIPVAYYRFVYLYCRVHKPIVLKAVYAFGALSIIAITSGGLLGGQSREVFNSFYYFEPGPLYLPFLVSWVWIVVLAQIEYWKEYLAVEDAIEKKRILIAVLSTLIGFVGGSMNFLPAFGIDVYPWGNFAIAVAGLLQAYAMFVYKFMDVEVAVTKTGIFLATYIVVLGVPLAVGWWGGEKLQKLIGQNWWMVPVGLCIGLGAIGPFAYAYFRRQTEDRLMREQKRYQRTLQHAARGMTQVRSVTRLSQLIVRVVSRTIRVKHASLFLWDRSSERYLMRASHGPQCLSTKSWYVVEKSHPLIRWMNTHRRIVSDEDLLRLGECIACQELRNLSAVLIIPGFIEDQLIGFLALGEKLSGTRYSSDDLHAFTTLANEAAIAIENAVSYEALIVVNEQLKIASERLLVQERLAAAGQLAAGMAHEIRNPLASIKTFAEYLPAKYDDPQFRRTFFRVIQGEVERIDGIVKELLDFAKPAPLQLQPVNVSRLAQDTLALLSDQCLKQGVGLETTFDENGITVQADAQQLKQVILNLLLNSLDAMPKGGRLEVTTSAGDGEFKLRVSDTGEGVAPEYLHQVWDPFFTTKERGMGLGLAIVKGIVERHGGRINLSSRVGHGTIVEICLPADAGTQEVSRG